MQKIIYRIVFLVAIWSLTNCGNETKDDVTIGPSHLNWESIADKVLEQCRINSGEQVLLVGEPGRFNPLIALLKSGIEAAGGEYLGTVSIDAATPESWQTDFTNKISAMSDEELPLFLSSVDLGIMLPGATPSDRVYAAMQEVLKDQMGRTIHFHWAGAYNLNGQLLESDSLIDIFYQDVILNTDYNALASRQAEFEMAMRGKWIEVTTPEGTNIKFQIGNRPVTKQDGNASMAKMKTAVALIDREIEIPAGAIRVAPIEETVEGVIAFPDSEWSGEMVKNLKVKISKGKVIEVNAAEHVENALQEMDQAGDAGRSFREFALGFNPMLAIPDKNPWIPYYGYGAGVVRLSLGDNTELGGNVSGGYVRWNFFVDATVKVDGEIWVAEGKLIK